MRFARQGGVNALAVFASGDAQQQGYAAAIMANLVENGTLLALIIAITFRASGAVFVFHSQFDMICLFYLILLLVRRFVCVTCRRV